MSPKDAGRRLQELLENCSIVRATPREKMKLITLLKEMQKVIQNKRLFWSPEVLGTFYTFKDATKRSRIYPRQSEKRTETTRSIIGLVVSPL